MDNTDKKLLSLLARNADVTATELVPALHLSVPAINKRIARLKEAGVIRQFTVLTDGKLVEKPVTAFVLVALDNFMHREALTAYVEADEDVLECYAITGEYDFILKICARDIDALEEKLIRLKQDKGVAKSHTLLALMEDKCFPVPLPDLP